MFKIVEFSHYLINEHYKRLNKPDCTFIDATCGMGNDSLFMANLLKESGKLICYDIQEIAINETKKLLQSNGFNNVTYKLTSFENITEICDLVIYNCGYLPGHNKNITTQASSTLKSVSKLCEMISINEDLLIIIVLYPGHDEGKIESKIIDDYCLKLSSSNFLVCKYQNYNRLTSPYIITISKNKKN